MVDGDATPFLSTGDWEPLGEATLADDGTFPVKVIAPGTSKNGRHYSEELLVRRAGVYRAGTHMYWNHAGPLAERDQPRPLPAAEPRRADSGGVRVSGRAKRA
jgi:hypothetical protein